MYSICHLFLIKIRRGKGKGGGRREKKGEDGRGSVLTVMYVFRPLLFRYVFFGAEYKIKGVSKKNADTKDKKRKKK